MKGKGKAGRESKVWKELSIEEREKKRHNRSSSPKDPGKETADGKKGVELDRLTKHFRENGARQGGSNKPQNTLPKRKHPSPKGKRRL